MKNDCITIPYSIFNSELFRNSHEFTAFIWLVFKASKHPEVVTCRHSEIWLKRGEIVVSTRDFANQFKWSQSKAVRFFKKLEKTGRIKIVGKGEKPSNLPTILKICNYSQFEGPLS